MREILFRGIDSNTGDWVYGYLTTSEGLYTIQYQDEYGYYSEDLIDQETVGQFTGSLDQFNRKIFEGDIIYYSNGVDYEVYWDSAELGYKVRGLNSEDDDDLKNLYPSMMRIIGNIYDNPELLGAEQFSRN